MNNKKVSLVMVSALALVIMASGAAYAQDQKKQAVVEKELQEKSMQTIAKEMGFDPTGLTNEQIKKAISEKANDMKSATSQRFEKKPTGLLFQALYFQDEYQVYTNEEYISSPGVQPRRLTRYL